MIVKNTKATRSVQQAVATMAISGMYFDQEFIEKMITERLVQIAKL